MTHPVATFMRAWARAKQAKEALYEIQDPRMRAQVGFALANQDEQHTILWSEIVNAASLIQIDPEFELELDEILKPVGMTARSFLDCLYTLPGREMLLGSFDDILTQARYI